MFSHSTSAFNNSQEPQSSPPSNTKVNRLSPLRVCPIYFPCLFCITRCVVLDSYIFSTRLRYLCLPIHLPLPHFNCFNPIFAPFRHEPCFWLMKLNHSIQNTWPVSFTCLITSYYRKFVMLNAYTSVRIFVWTPTSTAMGLGLSSPERIPPFHTGRMVQPSVAFSAYHVWWYR